MKMKVDVPASVAYNFYLYFDPESFPKLMPFISSVEVLFMSHQLAVSTFRALLL